MLGQGEGAIGASGVDQEDRQAAMALDVIRIVVEALIVERFGLDQHLFIFSLQPEPMFGRGQVVVAVGIIGVEGNQLLGTAAGQPNIALARRAWLRWNFVRSRPIGIPARSVALRHSTKRCELAGVPFSGAADFSPCLSCCGG